MTITREQVEAEAERAEKMGWTDCSSLLRDLWQRVEDLERVTPPSPKPSRT